MLIFPPFWRDSVVQDDMADFEAPAFSKKQVIAAGEALKGHLAYDPEAVEIFKIVHNWRSSHMVPMRHLRAELSAKAKKVPGQAITAARPKRMRSIRKKLRTNPHNLYQMQDIAGCRAILDSQAAVNQLLSIYRAEANHTLQREYDYIGQPKEGGYRSHHLVYKYCGAGDFECLNSNALSVEIQLRTRLQHAWATAVEAVGMVRNEDLKGGQGNEDWLRFFALMASEFAAEEGAPLVPGTPVSDDERRREIIGLNRGLNALTNLQSYSNAVKVSEQFMGKTVSPNFLLQFDPATNLVSIKGLGSATSTAALDTAEKNTQVNSVLVQVDRASDLRAAYPNYFMDVQMFSDRLKRIVGAPKKKAALDMEWLRTWIKGSGPK